MTSSRKLSGHTLNLGVDSMNITPAGYVKDTVPELHSVGVVKSNTWEPPENVSDELLADFDKILFGEWRKPFWSGIA
jgi:hypothetical protein